MRAPTITPAEYAARGCGVEMSAATDYPNLRDLLHGPMQPYRAWEVCPACGESGSALDLHLCPEKVRVEIARLRADLTKALGGDCEGPETRRPAGFTHCHCPAGEPQTLDSCHQLGLCLSEGWRKPCPGDDGRPDWAKAGVTLRHGWRCQDCKHVNLRPLWMYAADDYRDACEECGATVVDARSQPVPADLLPVGRPEPMGPLRNPDSRPPRFGRAAWRDGPWSRWVVAEPASSGCGLPLVRLGDLPVGCTWTLGCSCDGEHDDCRRGDAWVVRGNGRHDAYTDGPDADGTDPDTMVRPIPHPTGPQTPGERWHVLWTADGRITVETWQPGILREAMTASGACAWLCPVEVRP